MAVTRIEGDCYAVVRSVDERGKETLLFRMKCPSLFLAMTLAKCVAFAIDWWFLPPFFPLAMIFFPIPPQGDGIDYGVEVPEKQEA